MGRNLVQKILDAHRVDASADDGEVGIRIDQTLTQDATGTMAFLQFEAMKIGRVRNELAVSYVDHNTVQVGFENADDHHYLRTVAAAAGAIFSKPGNGICHQLHLERFGVPGKTLLGADSHTPTGGGIGMLAIGAGGIDVAVAMGGGPFFLPAPRVTRIWLEGALPPWVSAKDVILHLLARVATKGNVGRIFEYDGPGVAGLDVPERATIANMGAETGATTSIFPSDERTRAFLRAQDRGASWRAGRADPDAVYADEIVIDLAALEPLAAMPHSPGRVASVASLAGTPLQQVLIGSCTNASYRDLKTVAAVLKGRTVPPEVSLGVAHGSRQVMGMLATEGDLAAIFAAGARLLENACGFCIGNSMSPGAGDVSLRTSNRNFEGRSGTRDAQVYLVSPETAVVSALRGAITDPRTFEAMACPRPAAPDRFWIDDGMFVPPPADPATVVIRRGPNIGAPPVSRPPVATLDGEVAIKVGDDITTDHIMPAGARLCYRSNIPAYARYVFEPVDPSFAERAARLRDAGRHGVIVAGQSYGQGSSREHAAICPMYLGIRAVVAVSIERIHMANLINMGIAPLRFAVAADHANIAQGDAVRIDGFRDAVAGGAPVVLVNCTRGCTLPLILDIGPRRREILLAGGLLNATRNRS